MIQFNLLPDVKIEYIRSRRQKRLVMLASTITIIISLTMFVFLIVLVDVLQKKNLSDLNSDIKKDSNALQSTPNLTSILTVQNQLKSLPALHDAKAVAPRLFGYLSQLTPISATIAKLNVDFAQNTISISGSADTLSTVNIFTDTLKFTTYNVDGAKKETPAFSAVVLSAFGRDTKGATYTITLKFDPVIFQERRDVKLTVPKKTTTRSEVGQPAALFKQTETQTNNGAQ